MKNFIISTHVRDLTLDYKKFNKARVQFRAIQYLRKQYQNDTERNYNRLNMLIKDKLFDIYEYLGFDIRNKREEVFAMIKNEKRNTRKKDHQNKYKKDKKNLKKILYMYIKKLITKIENEDKK